MSGFYNSLLNGSASNEEIIDEIARVGKQLDFLLSGNLGSKNIREVGDYLVGANDFVSRSGTVGISSLVTGADDLRFWAGSATRESAPFRVYESGDTYVSNLLCSGGTISGAAITSGSTINIGTDATIGNNLYMGVSSYAGSKKIIWSSDAGIAAELEVLSGDMNIRTGGFITLTIGSSQGLVVNKVVAASALKSNTITNNSGVSVVFSGTATSSTSVADSHNHGLTSSDYIQCYDSAGVATSKKQFVPYGGSASHSHFVT